MQPLTVANRSAISKRTPIPVPAGLDLDAWIIPPPKHAREELEEVDENGVPVASSSKKKKGKEKTDSKIKGKKSKGKDVLTGDVIPADQKTRGHQDQA